jgi:AraC family transcriptional regulator of adaptative response/methylated-DNA-[protein]-cysteine methyltransferase
MQAADSARIAKAILYLAKNFRNPPDLEAAARVAGMSRFHFQRTFTRWAGISPKRFLQVLSAGHAREILLNSDNMLEAAFESGLSGPGRLHDLMVNVYAVTPGEIKERGAGITIRYGVHEGPLGPFFLAVTEKGICALTFLEGSAAGKETGKLRKAWKRATLVEDRAGTKAVADRIFFPREGDNDAPLSAVVKGTNFQVRVWEALVRIPPGRAVSYEGLASRVGTPRAVRAVGSACARNPVAYLIPCHRVIRKTGAFGNYGGGVSRKRALLALEAARREEDGSTGETT